MERENVYRFLREKTYRPCCWSHVYFFFLLCEWLQQHGRYGVFLRNYSFLTSYQSLWHCKWALGCPLDSQWLIKRSRNKVIPERMNLHLQIVLLPGPTAAEQQSTFSCSWQEVSGGGLFISSPINLQWIEKTHKSCWMQFQKRSKYVPISIQQLYCVFIYWRLLENMLSWKPFTLLQSFIK